MAKPRQTSTKMELHGNIRRIFIQVLSECDATNKTYTFAYAKQRRSMNDANFHSRKKIKRKTNLQSHIKCKFPETEASNIFPFVHIHALTPTYTHTYISAHLWQIETEILVISTCLVRAMCSFGTNNTRRKNREIEEPLSGNKGE